MGEHRFIVVGFDDVERQRIAADLDDRQVVRVAGLTQVERIPFRVTVATDVIEILGVELSVQQPRGDLDRLRSIVGNVQPVVQRLTGTGRHLVAIQRRENVLGIASVDAIAVAIEHERVHEVRVVVDDAAVVTHPAARDHAAALAGDPFDPHLIAVRRALGEVMADLQRPQHRFDQHRLAGDDRRPIAQRGDQFAIDPAVTSDTEQVHAEVVFQERPVTLDRLVVAHPVGQRGVRRRKRVVVNRQPADVRTILRPETVRRHRRHVTLVTVVLGLGRIIETAGTVAGHAGQ